MNDNNFIKEIGRSYLISAFLPSALFVSLGVVLFRGFVPIWLELGIDQDSFLGKNSWAFILIFTLWVAFFLFSSVDWIVKLFEGYYIPEFLHDRMVKKKLKLHKKKSKAYNQIAPIVSKSEDTRSYQEVSRYTRLYGKALAELHNLETISPINPKILMPTRLGNVLRASEVYADERYDMVSVTIWPRLFPILPRQFIIDMEEKYNQLMFLLNSSLLTFSIAVLSFLAGMAGWSIQMTNWIIFPSEIHIWLNNFISNYQFIQPGEYILLSMLFVFFGYMMYNASVNTAQDYTFFIRAGFDLYRKDLIEQMNFEFPSNLDKEKLLWRLLSEYFIAGERLAMQPIKLPDYKIPKK